jgi:hypothetical protein
MEEIPKERFTHELVDVGRIRCIMRKCCNLYDLYRMESDVLMAFVRFMEQHPYPVALAGGLAPMVALFVVGINLDKTGIITPLACMTIGYVILDRLQKRNRKHREIKK